MRAELEFLGALPFWAVLACLWVGTGRFIFSHARYPFDSSVEEIGFAFGLGACLFASVIWVAGLLSALRVSVMIGAVGVFALPALFAVSGRLKIPYARFGALLKKASRPELYLIGLAALAAAATFVAAGCPQPGRDALAYHFYCPKWFLLKGSVYPVPYSVNALQPFLEQMIFLFGLFFKSEAVAKLFNLTCILLLCVLTGVFSRRLTRGRSSGLVPAALVFLTPGLAAQAPYAYTDIALTFFIFLAFFALWRFFEEGNLRFLACGSFFAGTAAATKIRRTASRHCRTNVRGRRIPARLKNPITSGIWKMRPHPTTSQPTKLT